MAIIITVNLKYPAISERQGFLATKVHMAIRLATSHTPEIAC